jgi:exodeoxyribonuclease VII small subunit
VIFEEEMARLEAIASELDAEDVPLDRALQLFAEGVAGLRRASFQLSNAEAEVALLVEQMDGSLSTRPLSDQGPASPAGAGSAGLR